MLSFAISSLLAGASTACALATNIYVASYDGNVTTLSFSGDALETKYRNPDCKTDPVWLQLDSAKRILYCLDEGDQDGIGGAIAFNVANDGKLTRFQRVNITAGPVSSIFYNSVDRHGLAIAHYGGSALTSLNVSKDDSLTLGQTFKFNLTAPGPLPAQTAPHPHEVILDPTGKFIAVPDLGADLVRVFSIDLSNNLLTPHVDVKLQPGTGPRHGVFWSSVSPWDGSSPVFFHLLGELSSSITSFKISYTNSSIRFDQIGRINSYGGGAIPAGAAAAEIAVSPDNKFIVASNRNDSSFTIPNFNPANSTQEKSDSLAVYAPQTNGSLAFIQLAPAGGSFPRQFQINKAGDKLVTGLQQSARVVVIERDVATGKFGKFLANITVPGQVTTTVWDE